MTDFAIEKGVPFPPESFRQKNGQKGGRPSPYGWASLEVGDSVLVGSDKMAETGRAWASRRGRRFVIEKQDDGSGWRVWRKT